MRKRAFVIILQLIIVLAAGKFCKAQDISYTVHNTKLFYYYRNALALPDGRLLVTYGKNDWLNLSSNLHLIVHKPNGDVANEKFTALHNFGFELYLKDAFVVKGNIYFLCVNDIKGTNDFNYALMKLDPDSLNVHLVDKLQFNNISAGWLKSGEYHLCFSPDSSLVGFVTVSPIRHDFTKTAMVNIVNLNELKISSVSSIPLGTNANTFQMKDIAITNSGNILMLVKYYFTSGSEVSGDKAGYKYLLQQYVYGKLKKSLNVTPDNNLMRDAVIKLNKNNRRVMVAAFESNISSQKPLGVRLYEVNADSLSVIRTAFIDWKQNFDSTLMNNGGYRISIDYNYPYFIFLDNQKLVTMDGARVSHQFDYYRGKLVCLETDSLLGLIKMQTANKYQLAEEMPDKSFVFDRAGESISYIQNENKETREVLSLFHLNSGTQIEKALDAQYWNKRKYYDILLVNNEVTIIQPQLKKYILVNFKLK